MWEGEALLSEGSRLNPLSNTCDNIQAYAAICLPVFKKGSLGHGLSVRPGWFQGY